MHLSSISYYSFKDQQGNVIPRGLFYLYRENSNTKEVAFANASGSGVTRDWPLRLNDLGVAHLWLDSHKSYRIVVYNEHGNLALYDNRAFRCGEGATASSSVGEDTISVAAKTLVYENGKLSKVLCYQDVAKTQLVKQVFLIYDAQGKLQQVNTCTPDNVVLKTKLLERDAQGSLVSVTTA